MWLGFVPLIGTTFVASGIWVSWFIHIINAWAAWISDFAVIVFDFFKQGYLVFRSHLFCFWLLQDQTLHFRTTSEPEEQRDPLLAPPQIKAVLPPAEVMKGASNQQPPGMGATFTHWSMMRMMIGSVTETPSGMGTLHSMVATTTTTEMSGKAFYTTCPFFLLLFLLSIF